MKLLILDGHSVANKAFYGIRMLNAPNGTPTNAIHGFINIFNRLISEIKPDAVCTCFDLKPPTFRHEFADYYKANRHPMPDEFAVQIPILKKTLALMGINNYELEGYEADDILGTVSRICEDNDWECYIATGDKDSFQLLTDRVSVCYLGKDFEIYTPEVFSNKYGFSPVNLIDYKSIAGDSSDNYPGVPGIGDKGATELITTYTNLDNIYNNIDNIKPSLANKLISGKDSAYDSYYLATIVKDAPIEFRPEDNIWNNNFKEGLYNELRSLGFYKLIDKWNLKPEVIFNYYDDETPDGIFITDNLKRDIDIIPKDKTPFDTTIAQYLINPLNKSYNNNVPYTELNAKLKQLELSNLYYNIELPLCSTLSKMERRGFLIDRQALEEFREDISNSIVCLESSIYNHSGENFNINSPKQLSHILFDVLGLPDRKKGSTNVEVLESLRNYHPIVDDLIEYRTLSKLKGTYCDGLINYIKDDGRIHTTFQQTVTATGRLSSTDPNLQNIPIRKEIGSKIRNMFIAEPGKILVDADYSQIELRLLAHMSDDKNMIDAFNSGHDFHKVTAANIFGVPFEDVTPIMRSRAKAVNFGIIYGMGAFSLAKDLNVSTSEAKAYIDLYFSKYEKVDQYLHDVVEKAKHDGYVSTLFGRRRPIPELESSNHSIVKFGERVALNMPIQGTAADIIKLAMIKADEKIDGMILQVHDELIVECPENEAFEISAKLKEIMEDVVSFSVPLSVDIGIGRSWSEAH